MIEDMIHKALDTLINRFRFTGKEPLREDVFGALNSKPKVLERKKIYGRIVSKLKDMVHTFDDDMGDWIRPLIAFNITRISK